MTNVNDDLIAFFGFYRIPFTDHVIPREEFPAKKRTVLF